MPPRRTASDTRLAELRAFGLALPGAHTKSPWPGHLDLAVNDKTFAYLSVDGAPFSISCKLPRSADVALMLPNTSPTAYGLGKSGWVSASPTPDAPIAVEILKEWILESYRAQAPKRLLALYEKAQLESSPVEAQTQAPTAARQPRASQTPAKQTPAKRTPAKQTAAKQPAASQPKSPKKQPLRAKKRVT